MLQLLASRFPLFVPNYLSPPSHVKVFDKIESETMVSAGCSFEPPELEALTVEDVLQFGRCFVVQVTRTSQNARGCHTSGIDALMQARQQQALPSLLTTDRYDCHLFNALIAHAKSKGLGFPIVDAEHSGRQMLMCLRDALAYILKGTRITALQRSFHLPARFADIPDAPVRRPTKHSRPCLDKQQVLDLGNSILPHLSNSQWAKSPQWKSYMTDVEVTTHIAHHRTLRIRGHQGASRGIQGHEGASSGIQQRPVTFSGVQRRPVMSSGIQRHPRAQ